MAVKNLVLTKLYLSPQEKTHLQQLAHRAGISLSELGRRLIAGRPAPAIIDQNQFQELIKLRADLARLGNLFKLALDHEEVQRTQYNTGQNLEDLAVEIRKTKDEINKALKDLS